MARLIKLVALATLALLSAPAFAGYAQLAPPAGWTPGHYAPSANDAVFGKVIHQQNGLKVPVPGTSATMPAAYRLAANAPRIAAAAIYAHPAVRTAVAIGTALGTAKIFWDAIKGWQKEVDEIGEGGTQYSSANAPHVANVRYPTRQALCAAVAGAMGQNTPSYSFSVHTCSGGAMKIIGTAPSGSAWPYDYSINEHVQPCPANTVQTPAGCIFKGARPVEQPEFVEDVAQQLPQSPRYPLELPPGTPLPVEQPYINPAPGENPQHRPFFVPTGEPVPNPNYNPNQYPTPENAPYLQPGVRVVPSPTELDPWRVDLQPLNRPTQEPYSPPGPVSEESPNPGDKPKPEEQQSLCEKHPDVVACAKLGNAPEAQPVPNEDRQLSIQPDTGWGEGGGSCPAPKTVQVHGFQLSMPFDLLCDFASGIRPVVIGLAWLAAAFTFMGLGRRE